MDDIYIWYVYMHINLINNKKYIGITSKDPKKRWGKNGYGYRKNKHFWNAIQKYGWENFKHIILLSGETYDYASKAERCLINYYKSNNSNYGYNQTNGGEGIVGWHHSEETKKLQSILAIGKYAGEKNPNYGISPKERMNEATYKVWLHKQQTNKPHGEEHSQYGISPKERMSEDVYKEWKRKHLEDNPLNIPVMCAETKIEYISARDAERETGLPHSSILNSCKSKDHSILCGGMHWVFVGDEIPKWLLNIKYNGKKYIHCFENDIIYRDGRDVKRELRIDDSSVHKCCKGKIKHVKGFTFEYLWLISPPHSPHITLFDYNNFQNICGDELYEECI